MVSAPASRLTGLYTDIPSEITACNGKRHFFKSINLIIAKGRADVIAMYFLFPYQMQPQFEIHRDASVHAATAK